MTWAAERDALLIVFLSVCLIFHQVAYASNGSALEWMGYPILDNTQYGDLRGTSAIRRDDFRRYGTRGKLNLRFRPPLDAVPGRSRYQRCNGA